MEKVSLKFIKSMVSQGCATDVTHHGCDEHDALAKIEGWFEGIAYSTGIYGITGYLFKGHNTGALYAITARTSAIYIYH